MRRNRNRTETERRTENVHDFDFIFLVSVAEFQQTRQVILIKSAHTQPRALYKPIVNMKVNDRLSSETIVRFFYKHNTIDYRFLLDNTQSDFKDHELNAVTWNNLYCKGFSAI